jgi:hypothetical protein
MAGPSTKKSALAQHPPPKTKIAEVEIGAQWAPMPLAERRDDALDDAAGPAGHADAQRPGSLRYPSRVKEPEVLIFFPDRPKGPGKSRLGA